MKWSKRRSSRPALVQHGIQMDPTWHALSDAGRGESQFTRPYLFSFFARVQLQASARSRLSYTPASRSGRRRPRDGSRGPAVGKPAFAAATADAMLRPTASKVRESVRLPPNLAWTRAAPGRDGLTTVGLRPLSVRPSLPGVPHLDCRAPVRRPNSDRACMSI
jgi:hypothetical protein